MRPYECKNIVLKEISPKEIWKKYTRTCTAYYLTEKRC